MDGDKQELRRILGFWDSFAIVIAIVIGVGIFRVPSEVASYLSSPHLILLAWLAGGMISALGAICYAELASSFPKTGGNYIYLRESYGPWAGFLFGWTELLAVRTGSVAAMAFIFAENFQSFFAVSTLLIKPIAICSILILSIANAFSLRYGKRSQNLFTIPKIGALIGMLLLGIILKRGDVAYLTQAAPSVGKGILSSFGLALIPILWTYGGWHENTFMAGETKNAKKTIPFALIAGVSVVTILYVSMNLLYLYMLPINKIHSATLIGSDVLQILCGKSGRQLFEVFIMVSSLGAINAMTMTGSRVTYALAKDNRFFDYIGKVNVKHGTPLRAIAINAMWSIMLVALGTFNQLLFFTGILVWLFFSLVVFGLFLLRHKFPDMERPYKVWGYPITPAIFVLICAALFIDTMYFYPVQSLMGLCILVSGIPVFLMSRKKSAPTINERMQNVQ